MELVVLGVVRVLNTLKLRISPATSKCIFRSPALASQALLTMISGCRFGTDGFEPEVTVLVAPLPVSNCGQKGLCPVVVVEPHARPPGNTTEVGTNCCGFSTDRPIAQELD